MGLPPITFTPCSAQTAPSRATTPPTIASALRMWGAAITLAALVGLTAVQSTASDPVFDGNLLEPGTHVNAAGANVRINRELDEIAVTRAGTIAADDVEGAKIECGDLTHSLAARRRSGSAPRDDVPSARTSGMKQESRGIRDPGSPGSMGTN